MEYAIPDVNLFRFVKRIGQRSKDIPLERLVSELNRLPRKVVLGTITPPTSMNMSPTMARTVFLESFIGSHIGTPARRFSGIYIC
jgi:hypothetical protein